MATRTFKVANSNVIEGRSRSELALDEISGAIQLQFGYPGRNTLERVNDMMKEACLKRLEEEPGNGLHLYQYGCRVGDPLFREQLAALLTKLYGYEVKRESLLATNGASVTLYQICSMFFGDGDYVFTEDPTYPLAVDTLTKELSRTSISVPIDDNGILPGELETALQKYYPAEGFTPSERKPYWSMLYLIPTFHNPTGYCLSEDRCRIVVNLARKYHLLVLCDDVYALLRWNLSEPMRLLRYYDNEDDPDFYGNVVSNGSFAKIVAPGLRLGWIEAPRVVLEKIVSSSILLSAGDFNHFNSGLMGKALEIGHIEQHVKDVCAQYEGNVQAIHAVFEKKLGGLVKYTLPKGGYFAWIQLPSSVHCDELAELCWRKYKVTFARGSSFTTNEEKFKDFIRICFTFYDRERLITGIKKLSEAILELHEKGKA